MKQNRQEIIILVLSIYCLCWEYWVAEGGILSAMRIIKVNMTVKA